MDWTSFFNGLSDEEKDKVAIIRVIECTNGVIQHAYRDGSRYALSIEETREAMQVSMGAIKRMEIILRDRIITFEPETVKVFRVIRDLYISGVKNGSEEDFAEFMRASEASVKGVGMNRLVKAADLIRHEFDNVISSYPHWGLNYLAQFAE